MKDLSLYDLKSVFQEIVLMLGEMIESDGQDGDMCLCEIHEAEQKKFKDGIEEIGKYHNVPFNPLNIRNLFGGTIKSVDAELFNQYFGYLLERQKYVLSQITAKVEFYENILNSVTNNGGNKNE